MKIRKICVRTTAALGLVLAAVLRIGSNLLSDSSRNLESFYGSSFRCVGDLNNKHLWQQRTCLFEDVCTTDGRTLIFFEQPDIALPKLSYQGSLLTDFPKPFLGLRAAEHVNCATCTDCMKCTQPETCEPIKYGRICQSAVDFDHSMHIAIETHFDEKPVKWVTDPAVYFAKFVPSNYGHIIGDDLLPMYSAAKMFGFDPRRTQFIALEHHSQDPYTQKWDARLYSRLSIFPMKGMNAMLDGLKEGSKLCFKKLVVGTSGLGMKLLHGRGQQLSELREHIVNSYPKRCSRKQRITLLSKIGRRNWINVVAVSRHLHLAFPNIEIVHLEAGNEEAYSGVTEWDKQVEIMLCTTVYVAIAGGASFVGLFLPEGASAILIDYFDPVRGEGGEVEPFYWNNMPWIYDIHYPVKLSNIDLESIPSRCGSAQDVSNCSHEEFYLHNDVNTSTTIMASLVYSALIRSEKSFKMGSETFDKRHALLYTDLQE